MFRKILSIGLALFLLVDEPVPAIAQSANPVVVAGTPTLVDGQAYPLTLDTAGRLKAAITGTVTSTPSGTQNVAPVTTSGSTSLKQYASGASAVGSMATSTNQVVYGFQVTSGASAGFILVLEGTVLPADGAVNPNECYVLAANSTLTRDYSINPTVPFSAANKLFFVFSTTGCFTKTISATAFISYRAP